MSLFARFALAYLLNSLWQVPLLYGAGLFLQWTARRMPAGWIHRLWVGTFLLQVVLPAVSLLPAALSAHLWALVRAAFGFQRHEGMATVTLTLGAGHVAGGAVISHWLLPGVLSVYAGWGVFCCGRLVYRLWQVHMLQRSSVPVTLPPRAAERWLQLCARFQVVEADVRVSPSLSGPVTVGSGHKLLLVPAWFTGLPLAEMEVTYAHELAHMQRNDYAKNLLLELFASPLAYHPFVHLTRMRLAESREMVCDALAAEALHGTALYANALLRLAARCVVAATPVTLPQAIGIFGANTLERRLMSLKSGRSEVSLKHRWAVCALGGAMLAGTCGSALALRVAIPQSQTVTQGLPAAAEPVQVSGGLMAGHTVTKVPPVYPEAAKQARIMGSVILAARIGVDGHVEKLTVLSGPPELQASATTAVQQWVYEPYMLDGRPVPVDTIVTINYQLNQ